MITSKTVNENISKIVASYISNVKWENPVMLNALKILLEDTYIEYDFSYAQQNQEKFDLQNALFSINEKTEIRKSKGVYYTPEDVCKYIIFNAITMHLDSNNQRTYKEVDAMEKIEQYPANIIEELLFRKKFFDPTCGSGEFILNSFRIKYSLLIKIKPAYGDSDIYALSKTLYGNDIDKESTDISKIRLFFEISKYVKSVRYLNMIAKTFNTQFSNIDYVAYNGIFNNFFDCIVGNPPYVEYGKYEHRNLLPNSYGNIYADVIENSIMSLKKGGTLGFVIPLSYVSTSRMSAIRNYVIENTNTQFVLSFADRPDCLFTGVHQKLNILVARKGKQEHKLFTSNYKHWYKEERPILLNGCEIKENHHFSDMFIPKIGNQIEENIYRKISTCTQNNIFDSQIVQGKDIFLNMRACFWIKAFTFNPGSNEYKKFTFKEEQTDFMHCVLNSSLFWLYWTFVSDCWHITTKELKGFLIPKLSESQYETFTKYANNLETKLEKTKRFIGTKQADYEYKHKECKKEIDDIDNLLAQIYELTNEELNYIKNFALNYRMGSGIDDKDN